MQQAIAVTQAYSGAIFLAQSDRYPLHLEIALPDESAADESLAIQAIDKQQIIKQQVNGAWFVYIPLTAFDTVLGALGFKVDAEPIPAHSDTALQMIGYQTAVLIANQRLLAQFETKDQRLAEDHRLLLTIYEAIPTLEAEGEPAVYIQHTAQTFLTLGWSPVRITLHNPKIEITEPYSVGAGAEHLPDHSLEKWNALMERATLRLGEAYFIPYNQNYNLLLIRVNTSEGDTLATIELYRSTKIHSPSHENIRTLAIFARQFGNAIDRAILIRSLRQTANLLAEQLDELEFTRRADREISSRLDPDRVVKFTLDWALRRTAADAAAIVMIDPKTQKLSIREVFGFPQEFIKTWHYSDPPYRGIVGRCLRQKRTQIVEDVHSDPDYEQVLPNTVTQLTIPLISNKRLIGAITLESQIPGRFDSSAVSFVERIASMAAIALDNAYLLQQAEQLADDMSLIHNAGRTISSSLEWETTIQSIAQGMALAVKGSNALIYAYDTLSQTAKLLSAYTTADHARLSTQVLPQIGAILEINRYPLFLQVATEGKMITIDANSPDSKEKHWLRQMEATAAGITPLSAQGKVVGLAFLLKTAPEAQFAASEIFVAESLATQAAAILRQASLYSEIMELEKLKSEMIRMASHDLRAPIANVMGYLELLEMDLTNVMTPDMQSYLESIKRSIRNMDALVEDLLTLEKVESQRSEAWETLELNALIEEVLDSQQATAELKHQALLYQNAAPHAKIRGNRIQLRQAIMNLISNGLKYTPEKGTIQVKVYTTDEGHGRVYFQVIDNGYGIPKNRQARIFERFYRAKQPGTEHIPGTGLGLSLVKSIVERHSGKITFESEEGKGSTFTFWLPLTNQN